jgi:hypothetical protein
LLEKIAVNVHPNPDAPPGTYPGVTFLGKGIMTNRPFELAYEEAEPFLYCLDKYTTVMVGGARSSTSKTTTGTLCWIG